MVTQDPATGELLACTEVVISGDRLYFAASTPTKWARLWTARLDGSGVAQISDAGAAASIHTPRWLQPFRSGVAFMTYTVGKRLWFADSSGDSARVLHDAGLPYGATDAMESFVVAGDLCYFGGRSSEINWRLWVSDGSIAGTHEVMDASPWTGGTVAFTAVGGQACFYMNSHVGDGYDLWQSDGTRQGTRMVWNSTSNAAPAVVGFPRFGRPRTVASLGNATYFLVANDSSTRLYRTTGLAGVAELVPGFPTLPISGGTFVPSVVDLLAAHGRLFCLVNDGAGSRLWVTDGTAAGTLLLTPGPAFSDVASSDNCHALVATASGVAVALRSTALPRICVSDGTPAGTRRIGNGLSGAFALNSVFCAIGDTVIVSAGNSAGGAELWATDESGSRLLADITPEQGQTRDGRTTDLRLQRAGDRVYFTASPGTTPALWRTDGTSPGTSPVSLPPGRQLDTTSPWTSLDDGILIPVRVGDATGLAFAGNASFHALDVLQPPTPSANSPKTLGVLGGRSLLVQFRSGSAGNYPLFVTDCTSAGTRLLAQLPVFAPQTVRHELLTYLFADTGQVWASNGTPAGTTSRPALDPAAVHHAANLRGDIVLLRAGPSPGSTSSTVRIERYDAQSGAATLLWNLPFQSVTAAAATNDRLLFVCQSRLYSTDGMDLTQLHTGIVSDTSLVAQFGYPLAISPSRRFVFFRSRQYGTSSFTDTLWQTDGTAAGTEVIAPWQDEPGVPITPLFIAAQAGDCVYFPRPSNDLGVILYRAGTRSSGARPVCTLPFVPVRSAPGAWLGSKYLTYAQHPVAGFEPVLIVPCAADLARRGRDTAPDGDLTADDLVAFLDCFFSGNIAIADIASRGGDIIPDGELTTDDLIVFLNSFIAGCP